MEDVALEVSLFPTKEEILENARAALDYKQKTELNNKLIDENISLKKKIGKLKQKLQISNLDYEDLNEKIHAMKNNFISLVLANQQFGQNNFQAEQNKLFEENYVISKEEISKYPIFESMINRFVSNKPDQFFLKFCSLMRILNSKSYDYLYEMLPLYSVTSCKYFVRPLKQSLIEMIQNPDNIINILEMFYENIIEFDSHKAKNHIYITLGGDVASLKPSFISSTSAVYTYEVLPLDENAPPSVINMIKTQNGPSTSDVVDRFFQIADYLTNHNFIVKFISTDGDVSFDQLHRDFFDENIAPLLEEGFETIVFSLIDQNKLPISDPFHLLKAARARLINHLILIDIPELRYVNTQLFMESVDLGPVFTDRNSAGAMKDDYVLALFSWHTFVEVMKCGRYDAAFYILPFVYLVEALRSPHLSRNDILNFLEFAFDLFKQHYDELLKNHNADLFSQRYRSSSIGVFFADAIFLKRIIRLIMKLQRYQKILFQKTSISNQLNFQKIQHSKPLRKIHFHTRQLNIFIFHQRLTNFKMDG